MVGLTAQRLVHINQLDGFQRGLQKVMSGARCKGSMLGAQHYSLLQVLADILCLKYNYITICLLTLEIIDITAM